MPAAMKAVQDKVSGPSPLTMGVNCEGQINAISMNKDSSMVVVAGRTVFKIYSIEEDCFQEKHNLRVGKNINLNFCAADIAWNQTDENILATGATNGAVVIWDLNRLTRSKQDHVFQEHKRTVNRVCFHENEHKLLSGSQDGSIKLFDTRRKKFCTSFSVGSTSIRDVQFCPSQLGYFTLASADDGGNVHIWDMRWPEKVEKQFTAHGGPVFSIDWHPEDRNWFATAGRDKTIKVWELSTAKSLHCIHNIASVAKVRWRPQRRHHIATCALLVDFNINVWDVRRPYVPLASFDQHKDVATSILFKNQDPHVILSGGKDHFLYQHVFRDAKKPADDLIPTGVAVSIDGTVGHAYQIKKDAVSSPPTGWLFKKPSDNHDTFLDADSNMNLFELTDQTLSMSWFVESAKRYKLKGRSLEELCDHNASVARDLERHQVAQTWLILKTLYCTSIPQTSLTSSSRKASVDRTDLDKGKAITKLSRKEVDIEEKNTDHTSGCSDEETSDKEVTDKHLTSIARGQVNPDWDIFGDGEPGSLDMNVMDMGNMKQSWVLPNEAFQPRHEILDRETPLEPLQDCGDSPGVVTENEVTNSNVVSTLESISGLSINPQHLQLPDWDFTYIVTDMLKYFAQEGDVQTPVSILIVMKDKIKDHIDEATQENWFYSYIELLGRFSLWSICNEVIKLSHLPQIYMMNQQSTIIHLRCNKCNRPLLRCGWLCDRCKLVTNLCSICNLPVKGQFLWCQGCSHGGHLQHIRDWLSRNTECPAGCGHLCEYT